MVGPESVWESFIFGFLSVDTSVFVWVLFVQVYRHLIWGEFLEFLCELLNFLIVFDIFWVCALESVFSLNNFLSFRLELGGLSNRFILSEEVSEFLLEFNWIIELSGSSWALNVEPKNGIKNASINKHLIL